MTGKNGAKWAFESYTLNAATSELTRDGVAVSIEPQSLRLLEYLIQNRDRVAAPDELITAIWQGRAVSDWVVSGAIKAVRVALGDTGKDKQFIRTIHSRGYRFIADVSEVDHEFTAPDAITVLVRMFRSSPNDEGAYLASGLTEDLITDLSRQPGLNVLSFNAAKAIGDGALPVAAGVTRIIDGGLRLLENAARINVAILSPDGMRQHWAERFDVSRTAMLAGQDQISARVIGALLPSQATGQQQVMSKPAGTRNAAAYDHYLKGRYAYFRYEPAVFADALGHFTAATELDPTFADAFAQQAYCRTTLYVFGLPGADQTLETAEALARRAISLNDQSALGYARLGWVLGYLGQPKATVAAFETAITCDPENPEVYLAYGETMNRLAQPDKAESLLDIAFSKDSYFPPSWEFARGHSAVLLGEHDRAIEQFGTVLDRVERFMPARVQLARAYWEVGLKHEATEMVTAIKAIAPKYSLAHAGRMFPYPVAAERARLIDALAGAGMV